MEKGFLFLDEMLHGVRWDAKYATWDNFTGKPVDGYEVNRIVGTRSLGLALQEAQSRAAALGCGLLLWDGYRPKAAVDCFLRWARQPEDNLTKEKYYPNIARDEMIAQGYVAAQSSHSRGSTIDLTLYRLDTGALLPMGSGFDFMDERSHHAAKGIGGAEAQNRQRLREIMESSGFRAYCFEWWHYGLVNEPYPDTYFNIAVA